MPSPPVLSHPARPRSWVTHTPAPAQTADGHASSNRTIPCKGSLVSTSEHRLRSHTHLKRVCKASLTHRSRILPETGLARKRIHHLVPPRHCCFCRGSAGAGLWSSGGEPLKMKLADWPGALVTISPKMTTLYEWSACSRPSAWVSRLSRMLGEIQEYLAPRFCLSGSHTAFW